MGVAVTACGATVSIARSAWMTASSRRLPPHRRRVTVIGLPGVAAMQFAANGSPARAAARAITVLPASVPAPTTTSAPRLAARSSTMRAIASGANAASAG